MTGFGAASGAVGGARVSVEVRTVNHRFFNPSVKLPASYAQWEADVREALRRQIARGHVTAIIRIDRAPDDGAVAIDEQRFAAYVRQLAQLKERYGLGGEIDVATIVRLPNVVSSAPSGGDEEPDAARGAPGGTIGELLALVDAAARALTEMREAEGTRLAAYIEERLGALDGALARIAARAPERIAHQRDRLREAVRQLTGGIAIDEQRVAQEIAILADRLDVSEEIDRFRAHLAAVRGALSGPTGTAEPVGKRLGFLVQELLREANTIGSKAADAQILHDVVSIKEEIERIREQVDNLE
jgi:uncharacterized protein (TIGR00255 family)